MTNDELKKARKIARQAYEDSLVARPMFDERFDDEEQTLLISLASISTANTLITPADISGAPAPS